MGLSETRKAVPLAFCLYDGNRSTAHACCDKSALGQNATAFSSGGFTVHKGPRKTSATLL